MNNTFAATNHYALTTEYKGPTDARSSSILVKCDKQKLRYVYDDEFSTAVNHHKAAQQLADKMGIEGTLVGGTLPDGFNYAWIVLRGDETK